MGVMRQVGEQVTTAQLNGHPPAQLRHRRPPVYHPPRLTVHAPVPPDPSLLFVLWPV
jgi:hypothetical protein